MNSFEIQFSNSRIVGAAIHDGHYVRNGLQERLAIVGQHRLREEDPFTGRWASLAPSHIVGNRSRFEVDLNRPREKCVYQTPEDAWGIQVWKSPLDRDSAEMSRQLYDNFYQSVFDALSQVLITQKKILVLDLHSYNHRRDGADAEVADTANNPEVNIGTGTMDRDYWSPVIDRLIHDLRQFNFNGRSLDVRENVKFQGGHFGKWLHQSFPRKICAPAIEFKKFFMDEWTGDPDWEQIATIGTALQSTFPGIEFQLQNLIQSDQSGLGSVKGGEE